MRIFGVISMFLIYSLAGQEKPADPSNPPQRQQAQAPVVKPEDKCTIEGTVVNAATGEPLKKAHLSLMRMDANQQAVAPHGAVTDSAGRYRLENIDPGRYSFTASRNGFVLSNYGKGKPGLGMGTPLTLSARQAMKDVVFRLTPQAVISGRVIDEDGEPLGGAQIRLWRAGYVNGKKTLMPQGYSSTDDRGDYRAFGLGPGKYLVTANYRSNTNWGPAEIRNDNAANDTYATTYYPSATTPSNAIPVAVTAGAEITAIDLKMIRMRAVQISGVVTGSPQSAPVHIMLLSKSDGAASWSNMENVVSDSKGNFTFRGVVPGTYLLRSQSMAGNQPVTATTTVDVGDSNIENLQLAFSAGTTLVGSVVVDGKQGNTELKDRQIVIQISPLDSPYGPGSAGGRMKDDLTFEVRDLIQERYRVDVFGLPENYYLTAVRLGTVELPQQILDLTKGKASGELTVLVNPNGAQIEGVVQDKDQKPVAGARVVAVPEQRDYSSRYKLGASDQNGRFVVKGLAAGSFKLFAFDELEWGEQEDPDLMKPFEDRGQSVDLKEGAREARDLKLIVRDEATAAQKPASAQ